MPTFCLLHKALITVFLSDVCLARIAFAHCFPRDLYNALPQYWLEHLNGDPSPTVYADMYRVYVGLLYQCSEHGEVPASAWLDYVSSVFNDVIFPDLGKDIVALRALLLEQGNGTAEAAL